MFIEYGLKISCKVVIYNYFVLALIPCQIWFYVGFHCMSCVWERVWRLKTNWRSKEFSWVAYESFPAKWSHVLNTWLECEKSWQMMIAGFREYFVDKAFLRDTCETFCFAILSYLIHHVSTYTIYTIITHILRGVLFREKTLVITLES